MQLVADFLNNCRIPLHNQQRESTNFRAIQQYFQLHNICKDLIDTDDINIGKVELLESKSGVEFIRLTRRCRVIDKHVSSSAGLTVDEMHCLSVLFSEHPASVKKLSELINVSSTRVSKILRDLEERGLVSRTLDSADHRKEHVVLTDSGAQVVEKILLKYTEIGSKLLANWRSELTSEFS